MTYARDHLRAVRRIKKKQKKGTLRKWEQKRLDHDKQESGGVLILSLRSQRPASHKRSHSQEVRKLMLGRESYGRFCLFKSCM